VICSIIIIYVVTMVVNNRIHLKTIDCQKYILLSLAVFTCLSYKLSSLFLIFIIIPALGKTFFRRIVLSAGIGVIVLSSFFIRNYYLSGYLVYPYPKADIFKTDWKIPINNVHEMKIEIENWARIPSVPSSEISKMGLQGWVPVWFKALNFYNKLLVAVNLFLFLLIPVSLFRKDYLISGIQFIILINLAFWFIMAPDPRFSYGFLFSGFAFSIAYFSGLFEKSIPGVFPKLTKIGLICFIVVIIGRRIMSPVGTIINPDLWLVPDKFGTVSTNEYDAGFKYRVPVEDRGCCNTDLPCVPYQLSDVVLRGKDLQDGFKVLISNKNYPNE